MPVHRERRMAAGSGHPRVREYLAVKHRRAGAPRDAVTIEGTRMLERAAGAGVVIAAVFVCPQRARGATARLLAELCASAAPPECYEVSERLLARLVDRDGPDGVCAVVRLPAWRLDEVDVGSASVVVVLDRVSSPGNLGAIVRCADGAGATAVVAADPLVRVRHRHAVQASVGAMLTLPVVEADRDEALRWIRARGLRVVAADPLAATSYRGAPYGPGPVAVVLGNERSGLHPAWRAVADLTVAIPMRGTGDSLNIGHAAALLLYEVLATCRGA